MLDGMGPLEIVAYRLWIVVSTQPRREQTALLQLQRQGYVAYCPEIERTVSHARRERTVRRPLFPGCCFVEIDPAATQWRPILSTIGVRRVVRFGERLGYLPPSFIATLRAREIDGLVCRAPRPFSPGNSAYITHGAFAGIIAEIFKVGENDRVTMLLNLLQRPVEFETDVRHLTKA